MTIKTAMKRSPLASSLQVAAAKEAVEALEVLGQSLGAVMKEGSLVAVAVAVDAMALATLGQAIKTTM